MNFDKNKNLKFNLKNWLIELTIISNKNLRIAPNFL